jgi:hypothetical protein
VKLTKISQENKSVISIAQKELSRDVFDKIREWNLLSLADIKYLINEEIIFTKLFEPTEAEIVQLELQRNIGVENLSSYELMLINEIRTKDVAIEKVSKMLKEKLKAPDRCFLFPCPSSFPCLFKLTSFT